MLNPNCLLKAVDRKKMENEFNLTLKTGMLSKSAPTNTGFKKIPNDLQPGGCCLKSFMSAFD